METLEKFGIDPSAEARIMNYVDAVYKDYKDPLDGIKEIPLNLKGNDRYFGTFYYGTLYSKLFYRMTEKEKIVFLSHIVEGLRVEDGAIDYVTDKIIKEDRKFSVDDMSKITDSEFNEKEKYYMLFSYGLLFTLTVRFRG